jgi:curved DNA-binding protein CbpA
MASRPAAVPTHYDALKVAPDAPIEVIRAAYRSLSQKYHPDRNHGGPAAVQAMAMLNLAYDVLSNPSKKDAYDARLRGEPRGDDDEARAKSERKHNAIVKQHRSYLPALTRKRVVATTLITSGVGLFLGYALTQEHDPWLERAWQESWKPKIEVGAAVRAGAATAAVSEAATNNDGHAGLKWESSLHRDAQREGGSALRF